MGKTSKWLKHFLTGKKEKDKSPDQNPPNSDQTPATPKEKRRWSFRRSSATANRDSNSQPENQIAASDPEIEQKKHAMAMAAATAAAADAAVAAAQAAAAVIRLTEAANGRSSAVEEAAAVKIQAVFRSYLARKALCALKGLVKLQALVRGHLVRKQATATLRSMQALVTAQARARAQRMRLADECDSGGHRQLNSARKSTQENRFRHSNYDMEENIKIVEMDHGQPKSRKSYSNQHFPHPKHDNYQSSPAPSALTEMSPRGYSSHFEDYSFNTAQSSPQYYSSASKPDPFTWPEYPESLCYDHPLYPSYMANTESSRAKARSQSAPKQRPDSYERQPSARRRASVEGRNVPRAVRMQRSSSHAGATAQNYQYPWSTKLDRSNVSLKDSECGSTSTMLTNTTYCRTLVGFEVHGNRY